MLRDPHVLAGLASGLEHGAHGRRSTSTASRAPTSPLNARGTRLLTVSIHGGVAPFRSASGRGPESAKEASSAAAVSRCVRSRNSPPVSQLEGPGADDGPWRRLSTCGRRRHSLRGLKDHRHFGMSQGGVHGRGSGQPRAQRVRASGLPSR